jgi:hypothetical protein
MSGYTLDWPEHGANAGKAYCPHCHHPASNTERAKAAHLRKHGIVPEQSPAELSARIRELEGQLAATRRELPTTTHARRKASLSRFLVDGEAELSRLVTELGAAVQRETR